MSLLQRTFSKLYHQDFPHDVKDIFSVQKGFLNSLLEQYDDCPLYQKLRIKQEDVEEYDASQLKEFLSQYEVVSYQEDVFPLQISGQGLTSAQADLRIKTSGTSDAQGGGKLIPAQRNSFDAERQAIQRTLSFYLEEHPESKILLPYSFSLTAPFDTQASEGYISGAMRHSNKIVGLIMYPSQEILRIQDNHHKQQQIVEELLDKTPSIRSIHGVPAWPLGIMDELIKKDSEKAKNIFETLEYVSIGGGAPHDFKQQYEKRLRALGLTQKLYGSNNHNASEGFFGAQVRNFGDLSFQRMAPLYHTNFFLFVPHDSYIEWKEKKLSGRDMIVSCHLLHEVQPERIYFLLFANDRIPWLYDIKDKVQFYKRRPDEPLEYEVVGRYSMSSNVINEHLESDIIQQVLRDLHDEGYKVDPDAFVAGMELNTTKTSAKFHILIEGSLSSKQSGDQVNQRFDELLGEYNAQWKGYRTNNTRITDCLVVVKPSGFIRSAMMKLNLGHEQSKIPFLSDGNYESIVKPLLAYK